MSVQYNGQYSTTNQPRETSIGQVLAMLFLLYMLLTLFRQFNISRELKDEDL